MFHTRNFQGSSGKSEGGGQQGEGETVKEETPVRVRTRDVGGAKRENCKPKITAVMHRAPSAPLPSPTSRI